MMGSTYLLVGLFLFLLIIVLIGSWLWVRSSKQAKIRQDQVKEICYLLDRVAEAAVKRKTQLYESLDGGDNPALSALLEAAARSPVNIDNELQEMESLWQQLSVELSEFSNQSVQATLQSSVVTTRAAQTADRIAKLVQSTKEKLNR